MSSQEALWGVIHEMDWWLWGYKAAISVVALTGLYRLDAPKERLGWFGRMAALMGFILCALSPLNTAFGPFADIFVYTAFTALIMQIARQCALRRALETKKAGTRLERALVSMIDRSAR